MSCGFFIVEDSCPHKAPRPVSTGCRRPNVNLSTVSVRSGPLDAAALLLHCLQHPEEDAEEDAARRRRARAKVRRRLEDDRLSETSQSARASLPRIASQTDARLAALPDESSRTSSQPRARTPRELRRAKRLVTGSHTGLPGRAFRVNTRVSFSHTTSRARRKTSLERPRRRI